MPGPNDLTDNSVPAEDSFLELLAETLDNLERPARGQFLQRFFKTIAHIDRAESAALDDWEQILTRRRELSDSTGKRVSLKRAIVDVLASSSHLRVPVLIEYEDLKKLEINAATDSLTGLYNRRFFEDQCDKELNRALRYNQHLAIVMLDLHKFKEINDRYGHPRGDALLRMAATTLRSSLRTSDYAFRIGGDEFALLLVQSDAEQAFTLARRVRANFATATEAMQMAFSTGLDYGVSIYPPDGDQKEVLIRVADERLYEMKRSQRDIEPPRRTASQRAAATTPAETPAANPAPNPGATQSPAQTTASASPIANSLATPLVPPQPYNGTERRRWERVSLVGTRAYAQLKNETDNTARVLDLGYGGLAIETLTTDSLEANFDAVLHVPILPPVKVSLKKLYHLRKESGQFRIGCAFIT
jgi:diguanylate cyclase (GGDEF)-like protein